MTASFLAIVFVLVIGIILYIALLAWMISSNISE